MNNIIIRAINNVKSVYHSTFRRHTMYVCICNAITDHKIKEAVASGANSLTDLKDQLGVATCCGCCADLATSFLTANAGNAHTQMHSSIAVER